MSDRCSCPSSLFFPHRKEKCALNQILKTAVGSSTQDDVEKKSHSKDKSLLDQRIGVDNVDRVTGDNRSKISNSAEALEELGNRMCDCLLARKFPHRSAKCFQASMSRVAKEAVRDANEEKKKDLSETGCVAGSTSRMPESSVPTGQIKAHSDPELERIAEYQNTHQQYTSDPFARSSESQHQSTPKPTTHGNVGHTPGSQKNRNRSCHQNTTSGTCNVHQNSKANAKKSKDPQTRHQPAPRQTVIESTTVRTSTTYQTVSRGPK